MSEIDSKNIFTQLGLNRPPEVDNRPNDKLGQAEFLELMTTQLKFQDPLKPMENGDFLGQMAQFGTVSGVNELNTTIGAMSASFQSNQALQASTLVGRSVMVPSSNAFHESGDPIRGGIDLEQPASRVVISIKNEAGQLVHRQEMGLQPAGLVDFSWDGLDQDGDPHPSGTYKVSAEVHQGTEVSSGNVFTVVDVESVTLGVGGQGLTLGVSGLGEIDISQVRKIM